MAGSSLIYILDFSVKFSFQPIYTDYTNWTYFDKQITFKSSPLKPLNQIKANLAGMVLEWSPFNIMSDNPRTPFKMAAVTKHRNFFSCQFPLYYKSK